MQTKKERLTEALAAADVFFIQEWPWLLGCKTCTAHTPGVGWHPFDFPDVDVYEYDEETGEEVERLILTDDEQRIMDEWRQRGGLKPGYWLCPNGCNIGAEMPEEFHPAALRLRSVSGYRQAVGHAIDDADEAAFKAWLLTLPDDSPEFLLDITEDEAQGIIARFNERFPLPEEVDQGQGNGEQSDPSESIN
jgi:hypothetical protein